MDHSEEKTWLGQNMAKGVRDRTGFDLQKICLCGLCDPSGKRDLSTQRDQLRGQSPAETRRHRSRFGPEQAQPRFSGLLARFIDVNPAPKSLPLQNICKAAHERRGESGCCQILVIFQTGQAGDVQTHEVARKELPAAQRFIDEDRRAPDYSRSSSKVGQGELESVATGGAGAVAPDWMQRLSQTCPAFLCFAEVCSLDKLGHPDLLHALATGYDQVWVQQAENSKAIVKQHQEMDLVFALGGAGRVLSFCAFQEVAHGIKDPPTVPIEVLPDISEASSRWDIVRNCAFSLLPRDSTRIPLPDRSPYGRLVFHDQGCNFCQACNWVCPTEAITIAPDGRSLLFTEANCVQCGLCISVCHRQSLALAPSLNMEKSALEPLVLVPRSNVTETKKNGLRTSVLSFLGAV